MATNVGDLQVTLAAKATGFPTLLNQIERLQQHLESVNRTPFLSEREVLRASQTVAAAARLVTKDTERMTLAQRKNNAALAESGNALAESLLNYSRAAAKVAEMGVSLDSLREASMASRQELERLKAELVAIENEGGAGRFEGGSRIANRCIWPGY